MIKRNWVIGCDALVKMGSYVRIALGRPNSEISF